MKVAIIGAGISGLLCIKACLEENLEPHCFEKTDQLGGVWVYREQYAPGDPSRIFKGLRSNTSVYNNETSDFPYHVDDLWPTWEQQLEYTRRYAQHFGLANYIQYKSEVVAVEPDNDGWFITWSQNGGKPTKDRYPAVLVCTGRFHKPLLPAIPGLDQFQGQVLTSNQFKHNEQDEVKDKRVLIVGNSFTAADIAALSAQTAKQVYVSIGRGCSLIGVYPNRVPLDTLSLNRGVIYTGDVMTKFRDFLVSAYNSTFPDQEEYGICLSGGDLMTRPILYTSHDLTSQVRNRRVRIKHVLEAFADNKAIFNDGSEIEVDTVITATGHDISFPFLSKDIIADTVGDLELYKLMWPITTEKPNLAVVGCVKIIGSHTPFAELQARWAIRVFTGECDLPDKKAMKKEIDTRKAALVALFGRSAAQTEIPVLIYQDFMAKQIGALPTWWHYLLSKPLLAHIIHNGPAFPSTYRLVGPHRSAMAADRTIELYKRWRKNGSTDASYGDVLFGAAVFSFAAYLVIRHVRQLGLL